ncbi:MAG: type II toxin-antitoxin system PemK/MazF family toxin [bacterium]|nr:type II toxin-antitoxin system PemK/MazF family toxin [bacterium]
MKKEGEIWMVKFTGEGHEYAGTRPAVIIQSNDKLKITNVITVMPLTSKVQNRHSDDVLVKKNEINNLWHDSLVKVQHVQTFDDLRFEKKVGEIDKVVLFEIKEYLKKHFGL